MENLAKIIKGLETGIAKAEPTPIDEDSIGKFILENNNPIVFAPYSTMRFKSRKDKDTDETSAE